MIVPRPAGARHWLLGSTVLMLAVAAAAPTSAGLQANSAAFTDSRGDAVVFFPQNNPDPADITRVVVSNDHEGLLTFRIHLFESPALREDYRFRILFNDGNPKTGPDDGRPDFSLVWESRCGGLCVGATDDVTFSYHPNVAAFTISADTLDLRKFGFVVVFETGVVYDPITLRYDFSQATRDVAPDQVGDCQNTFGYSACRFWNYGVRYGPARLAANSFVVSPPAAGRPLTVRLAATRTDTGEPVTVGRVGCRARIGTASLRVAQNRFVRGRATCVFRVPQNATGQRVRGSITVGAGGLTLTRSFTRRVA